MSTAIQRCRVAVVHEWLVNCAGSEKVLEQILLMLPQADLYAVVDFLPAGERGFLHGRTPRTSFIQRLPGARKRFRSYLPLMPLAMEQLDLSGYDIVISSNHAVAKAVITGPDQLHLSYVHSPMRYAWDLQHQYLRESGMVSGLKGAVARGLLHYLRQCDLASANRVDRFVANSGFIARRIAKVYRREAEVVHPPVDVRRFALREDKEDFYLAASRLVPYKCMPMIVAAFARMPQRRLVVIGDGPDMPRVRAAAAGAGNVSVLGYAADEVLVDHMQRARALVFAAEEDFGIAPVEAQACGTPVIAFGRGGSLETVRGLGSHAEPTGLWFGEQSEAAVIEAVQRFESAARPARDDGRSTHGAFSPRACRAHAERFAPEMFRARLGALVEGTWERFCSERPAAAALHFGSAAQSIVAPETAGGATGMGQFSSAGAPSSVLPEQNRLDMSPALRNAAPAS
jgi:glycosyltransferase involved in cell wall biosynthesis